MEKRSLLDETLSNTVLQVDFSWKKFKARITEKGKASDHIYIVDFSTMKSPHLTFKSAVYDDVIGTGTLHAISIDADYEIHGENGTLKALKRFKTEYMHLLRAFSDEKTPVAMTWSSNCGFKTWDLSASTNGRWRWQGSQRMHGRLVKSAISNLWGLEPLSRVFGTRMWSQA